MSKRANVKKQAKKLAARSQGRNAKRKQKYAAMAGQGYSDAWYAKKAVTSGSGGGFLTAAGSRKMCSRYGGYCDGCGMCRRGW
ncbi:hypothetical protein FWH13_03475 [Candidatus Saccharibacteria bacterium]|nr:hypothetical protein [Candidatus Saccharibacteria bacterium]